MMIPTLGFDFSDKIWYNIGVTQAKVREKFNTQVLWQHKKGLIDTMSLSKTIVTTLHLNPGLAKPVTFTDHSSTPNSKDN